MSRAMKDSGITWIGEIPEGWQCRPIKNCFSVYSGATPKSEVAEYWDGNIIWVTPADFKTQDKVVSTGKRNLTEAGYASCGTTMVPAGSIIFSKRAPIGTVAIANVELCTNQGCLSCVPLKNADAWFFYYAISVFTKQFNLYGTGTTFKEISYNDFVNFSMPLPDITEQTRIATYLNRRCAEIDRVIAATQSTIEEYKKLKQSIITEAVTHGVRGPRKMKDSGVEWIGEIPEEWQVSRVGLHYHIILGKMLCSEPPTDEYTLERYICAANVHFDGISDIDKLKEMWFSPVEKRLYQVLNGDLLVVEGGAGAGGCAIVSGLIGNTFIQNSIMILRNKVHRDNRYLRYLIEYFVKQGYIDVVCNKATIPHFTKDKLATVPFPVMTIDEQIEIADYLDKRYTEIDRLIDAKQQFLAQLESYKKSVIYEYVTGKREVPA